MSREQRIAKLVAHRNREVDHAVTALANARKLAVLAQASVVEADEYLNAARATTAKETTAGDLRELDAHIRSLAARREQLAARLEAARVDESQRRFGVLGARVELKKMKHIEDTLVETAAREEDRLAQRNIDDRTGSLTARRSA